MTRTVQCLETEITLRPALPEDLELVRDQLLRLTGGEELVDWSGCGALQESVVAVAGDRVVGYGRWLRGDRHGARADVVVVTLPEWRRKGIGTAILVHLSRKARRSGVARLQLRLVKDAKLDKALQEHHAPVPAKVCDDNIVVTLDADQLTHAQAGMGLRWAAIADGQVAGPAVGGRPKTSA